MISFSTLIGITAGIGLFVLAVVGSTDNHLMFLSAASAMMVIGSTFAASLISFSFNEVMHALRAMLETVQASKSTQSHLSKLVQRFTEFSNIYRDGGISALEDSLTKKESKDSFLSLGIELMGSGYKSADIRVIMGDAMDSHWQRQSLEGKVLNTMGVYAPGFGMVGTIVGLIIMLDNMGDDMANLGKGLALALITTLYGVLLANLLFKPTAAHVTEKQEQEFFKHQLMIDGFCLLAEKRDALFIQDRLNAYVKPSKRYHPQELENE
ncbi:chemotaxis protein MotA [Bermanella marisrubri]|uniref:Chemotaxis MotA protein n=1 Tax=Bermanella marisrubri TaxID=207949 RepID=Q1N1L2_9GAMM|nr:MotA/TolQ/ExbB proton channel family protein [Bermanella marisrubri]EAT12038.1 chemotaxis MotA protein [Oceanobacter sp. RED65] [Bermanella marisrubri]QIZ83511.1 chemotaxis protein MotA [Bermanella marisrubri]